MTADNNNWGQPQAEQPRPQPQPQAQQPQVQQQPQYQPQAQQPQQQPQAHSQFQQPQPQPHAQQPQPQAQPQPQPHAQQPRAQQPTWQQPVAPAAGPYATAQPVVPTIVEKKSRGWIVAIVIVVCIFLLSAFCVKSCTDAVTTFGSVGHDAKVLTGDTIAIIDIDGTIQYDGSACSPEGFKELLDQAAEDSNIKAVVLRVNSGGGTATAGEEMAEYLRRFRENSKKPVVVSSASINASAAYEISAQADYIFVAKSTEIGAIGTAMELTDLSGLLDMLGVNMEVITSADSKDSSYGYRPLSDEERAYYQDMVDQINQMFIDNVAKGRNMSEDDVRALATGLAFTGVDAVENGLADEIGMREDALDKAAELAGIGSYDTTELYFSDYNLYGLSTLLGESDASVDDLIAALEGNGNARRIE